MSEEAVLDASSGWQEELARAVRDPAELLARLSLPPDLLPGALRAAAGFRLLVPRPYLARIRPGDPGDPLLRQVLPLDAEVAPARPGLRDPLQEADFEVSPGLIRKYRGRVLMVTTGVCAVHCRYCFRRDFPHGEVPRLVAPRLMAVEELLLEDPSCEEVVLSGGDPLAMAEGAFEELLLGLDSMPRLARIRIHTRLPVVLPARVDGRLVSLLASLRRRVVLVIHANHPAELDGEVLAALARLRGTGGVLLNQSVLLRGVNDAVGPLVELSRRLVDAGVLPYYLHLLDPVAGAMHFEVPEEEGRRLVRAMRAELPGYAVPRLVREVPGEASKRLSEAADPMSV